MLGERRVAAVVVAAGTASRMGFDKLFAEVAGTPVLRLAVDAFDSHPMVDSLVVVAGENRARAEALFAQHPTKKPLRFVPGGAVRADSAAAGVLACEDAQLVAIHDAARPFVTEALITAALKAAADCGAAAPALPVKDTIKRAVDGCVAETYPRDTLCAVQTPQVFDRKWYLASLEAIPAAERAALTDDCAVLERAGHTVRLVAGDEANYKITTPADLARANAGGAAAQAAAPLCGVRVGHGYDVHAFAPDRALVLGGVQVPYRMGLAGHSDADVLLHAIADALLGAAALGDIGRHFPDSDPRYKGADSLVLLQAVGSLVADAGFGIGNIDATVVCQAPKLAPHIAAMRGNIARALGMGEAAVSVKATTEEGLGFTGEGKGIAAHSVCTLFVL